MNVGKNFKTMLVSNTVDINGTPQEIMSKQNEVKEPMLIIMDENNQFIEAFNIIAADRDDLDFMYKNKIFYTDSIPAGKTIRKYEAIFYGTTSEEQEEANRNHEEAIRKYEESKVKVFQERKKHPAATECLQSEHQKENLIPLRQKYKDNYLMEK